MKTWQYYNHALIPTTSPDAVPDLNELKDKNIWKENGNKALFARWTTDFDCGYETNWWYVIKDEAFDISTLKSNYRYKINKGIKYFDVRIIDPMDYQEDLYRVQVAAFSAYPKKYRPTVDKKDFVEGIKNWGSFKVFGAFYREENRLVGYSLLRRNEDKWIDLSVQKTVPEYEKYQLNAALVEGVLSYYAGFLHNGGIICDGARSINHETAFQDYLEKYFGFRRAFCKLHITYNSKLKLAIRLLYPIRKFLKKMDGIGVVHSVNAVLKMEEICRDGKK